MTENVELYQDSQGAFIEEHPSKNVIKALGSIFIYNKKVDYRKGLSKKDTNGLELPCNLSDFRNNGGVSSFKNDGTKTCQSSSNIFHSTHTQAIPNSNPDNKNCFGDMMESIVTMDNGDTVIDNPKPSHSKGCMNTYMVRDESHVLKYKEEFPIMKNFGRLATNEPSPRYNLTYQNSSRLKTSPKKHLFTRNNLHSQPTPHENYG